VGRLKQKTANPPKLRPVSLFARQRSSSHIEEKRPIKALGRGIRIIIYKYY